MSPSTGHWWSHLFLLDSLNTNLTLLSVGPCLFSRRNKTQFPHPLFIGHVYYTSYSSSCCCPPPFPGLTHKTSMKLWRPRWSFPFESFPTQKMLFSFYRKIYFTVTWVADNNPTYKLQCICFCNSMTVVSSPGCEQLLLLEPIAPSLQACSQTFMSQNCPSMPCSTPPSRLHLQSVKVTLSSKHLLK